MKYCYINNELTTSTDISCHDRGFRFGDGVFETINVVNHVPYLLEYHIARLESGLAALNITTNTKFIKSNLLKLIDVNNHKQGLARIIISRGIGSMGYLPYDNICSTVIIETAPMTSAVEYPINICISSFEKPSPKSIPTGIKLLQGLNSTLAKMEAHERGFFEGLLLNQYQEVCEVSAGNIFWVKNGNVYTPSVACGLVAGIIRRRITESIPVITGNFLLDELLTADEVFITNVSWPVLAVNKIDSISFHKHDMSTIIRNKIIQDRDLYCS